MSNAERRKKARGRDVDVFDKLAQTQEAEAVADDIYGNGERTVSRSLRPRPDGTMTYGAVTLRRTGIEFPRNRPLSENDILGLGRVIFQMDGSIQWMIGDYLIYTEAAYSGIVKQLAEEFGVNQQTLRVCKMVASKVNPLIRVNERSFAHHRLVASLSPTEQQRWLQDAIDNDWSVARLRKALNIEQGKLPPTTTQRYRSHIASMVSYCKKEDTSAEERQAIIDEFKAALQALED